MDAVHSVGNTTAVQSPATFAVAMQIGMNKFAWENTTASVAERFTAMRRACVHHVGVFAWARGDVSGGNQRPPADMLDEWSAQLRGFVNGDVGTRLKSDDSPRARPSSHALTR